MVTQSYGSYSPAAIDPFPIETELAKAAITSPAQAQNLLDLYQTQRATSEGNYNYAMQGQHEFAKQQLAQQLYEANLKALPEMAKPGVARLLQGAPGYQGVFGGADQDTIAQSVGQAEAANQADVLSKTGSGANAFSQAGYGIPIPALEGMTGVTGLTPQTPRDIEIAKINAAARLGAASIGASGGASPSFSLVGEPQKDLGGAALHTNFGGKMRMTPEQVIEYAKSHPGIYGPQGLTSLPMAQAEDGGAPAKSATPAPTRAPAASAPPVAARSQGAKPVMDNVRTYVEANKDKLGPQVYGDIKAGMAANGGNPIIKKGPDGKDHVYGAKGGPY